MGDLWKPLAVLVAFGSMLAGIEMFADFSQIDAAIPDPLSHSWVNK